MLEFLTDTEIYRRVICGSVPEAKRFVWVATADIKDMHVTGPSGARPFLEVLSELIEKHVEVRLLHAKEPGPRFREDFDRYPNLIRGMERILCPRVHFKCVVVDGEFAYSGSANLTGAGMGAKGEHRRNFESGIVTTQGPIIEKIMEQFDSIWRGGRCGKCQRKKYCADFKDLLAGQQQ